MSDNFDLGGSGGQYFSFGPRGAQPGAHVQGVVLDMKEVQATDYKTNKPETWDNGDPKMQYRVTLQTELRDPTNPADDGKRDVYLDGRRRAYDNGTKSKLCAVLDAVREATGGTVLQRGGKLTLQWVSGMGESGDPRCYAAWYEAAPMNIGQPPGVPQQAAPPVQQAPPAAPPAPPAQQGPPPTWATGAQPPQQQQGPPPGWPPAAPPQADPWAVQQGGPGQPVAPLPESAYPAGAQPLQPPAAAPQAAAQQIPGLPDGVQLTPELIAALQAANAPQG